MSKKQIVTEGNPDFDWDAHMADCPSAYKKPNPHVKTKDGHKVYSREPYAQELYNLMENAFTSTQNVFTVNPGETHTGTVYSVDVEWASIDIGHKEMVYVNMSREGAVSKAKLVPGTEVSVEITGDRTSKGFILGSVEAGIKAAVLREMLQSAENQNTAYIGTVTGMIPNGGYFVNVQGVDCFMPGSLAGINKLADFESVLNTQMYVVPMSYSVERGTVIVSHRKYLQAMIPGKVEELRNTIGETKTGNVTGSAKYGVFVEFDGCLTGMIHANDLNVEMAKKHKAREIQPGDEIEFKVKEIISDTKITLTQLEVVETVDPWKEIAGKYKSFPTEVVGTIKSVKDYGVFVDIGDGIVGLLHVSELPEGMEIDSLTKNSPITVQITRIEVDTRKVFLKL
jgi:small subunit ribosomal protein S1